MNGGRRSGWLVAATAVSALGIVTAAWASGGPGTSVATVGADNNNPARDFAKCVCAIIDGDSAHPGGCLPKGIAEVAKRKKKDGCVTIATKADIEADIAKRMKKPGMSPAQLAALQTVAHRKACEVVQSSVGINKSREGEGWFALPFPSASRGNDYVKKVAIHDECNDLIARSKKDPAFGFPGPFAPGVVDLFSAAQTLYANLQSTVADIAYLETLKPPTPGPGATQAQIDDYKAWLDAYENTDAYMAVLITALCDPLKKLAALPGMINVDTYKALDACKSNALSCRTNVTKPKLTGAGRHPR